VEGKTMEQHDEGIARARQLIDQLWQDYLVVTPDAEVIHQLLQQAGERFRNDHIALRTFDVPRLTVERLAEPFLRCGYVATGDYHFAQKRLRARSYSHPSGDLPRVFISALELDSFAERVQTIVEHLAKQVSDEDPELLLRNASSWAAVPVDEYRFLQQQSEYAAWVAAFGVRANHFTVHVNDLKRFRELEQLNQFLEQNGFELNGEGRKIQGSPSVLLEQSSTVARPIQWSFAEGERQLIPGGYYEFARRYVDPATGRLYDGFVAASADKIFESTNDRADPAPSTR
jgi:hypothetical protein